MDHDRSFTDEDMAEFSDSSEWTADEFARSKSFAEAFPDLAASLKDGVTVAIVGTTPVSIRLADDVLAHYRAGGRDRGEALFSRESGRKEARPDEGGGRRPRSCRRVSPSLAKTLIL